MSLNTKGMTRAQLVAWIRELERQRDEYRAAAAFNNETVRILAARVPLRKAKP